MIKRRPGASLVVAGALAAMFFIGTDPAVLAKMRRPLVRHHWLAASPQNLIDAVNQGRVGTELGVAGSVVIAGLGAWLFSRRPV